MYLVVIDAYSKWPEVINFHKNTQAGKLVEIFESLFARHGLPDHVVSDNGRQFSSAEFAPNGAAENFVGTFKDKVSKIVQGKINVSTAITQFLFDYHSTPHCTTGKSPAFLLYKREIKSRFDLLRPNLRSKVSDKQSAQVSSSSHSRKVELSTRDEVMIDNYGTVGGKRIEAEITKQWSPSTFQVRTEHGNVIKRYTYQIVKPQRRSERIANKMKPST